MNIYIFLVLFGSSHRLMQQHALFYSGLGIQNEKWLVPRPKGLTLRCVRTCVWEVICAADNDGHAGVIKLVWEGQLAVTKDNRKSFTSQRRWNLSWVSKGE